MSSENHLIKLSPDVLLVLCSFLDTETFLTAAQIKPLNYAAIWTLHHDEVKHGWGPEKHTRALSWGAYKGYESVVRMALKMKSPIAESPFFGGCLYKMNGNAVHVAASRGHDHILEILLDHGGDINSWTRTEKINVADCWARTFRRSVSPLYTAIERGHDHTVRFLLDKGASLVIEKPEFNKPVVPSLQRRLNAMHIAAKYGQHHLIRDLHHQYAVDINLPDKAGNTALAYAMETAYNINAIEYLILEGADLTLADDGGLTPLHRAITLSYAEETKSIVTALIDAEADLDAFNNSIRDTPMTIAIHFSRSELIAMLVDAGAFVDAFHLRLALTTQDIDNGTRDTISACIDALLRCGIPEDSDHLVKCLLQEKNAAAAEIIYSRGIGLPDESPEGINRLLEAILDLPLTEYENKSLTFLLTHYGDIIRGPKPEELIAKLLGSRHYSSEAIVDLINPGINIR
ncbi:uncharacterized protein NECHADRAFT_78928 [Fusarium vanettenii 77-13-4]|uniref:Uncharacterized protein n=1 Tax=Fusarium vanettenii (strain ATCC MYA-4622 / CBS 123669 / FGSC 9596 / NRRL 45880 / 77-13-4) TaxID=660122 RepID=C7YPZ6_FUSV7|nr:uncharacterized protein NECHADRAFT_78928 [Fusarium vanettenii 77-13-4]EEU45936.1 hypothetical protein NECHADRAFT_78928 [Fusarium vanettenii 77-13-4]